MYFYVNFPYKLLTVVENLKMNRSRAALVAQANYLNNDKNNLEDAKMKFLDYRSKDYFKCTVTINDVFTFLIKKYVGLVFKDFDFKLFLLSLGIKKGLNFKPINTHYVTNTLLFTPADIKKLNAFLKKNKIELPKLIEFLLYFNKYLFKAPDYDGFAIYQKQAQKIIKVKTYAPIIAIAKYFETIDTYPFSFVPRADAKLINFLLYNFLENAL